MVIFDRKQVQDAVSYGNKAQVMAGGKVSSLTFKETDYIRIIAVWGLSGVSLHDVGVLKKCQPP